MNSLGGYNGPRGPSGSANNQRAAGRDIIPKGYQKGQLNQFTPEQNQLFKQQFQHVGPESYLSKLAGGDQSFYDEMEAPAWRQFEEGLGERAEIK